ncbi:MAG: DNRLRE domain-containing protein, partial [Verrucomicrobia bacterium]|nr:DNRLRE domain-containing protein [Verrucomicrobiota bacterium]
NYISKVDSTDADLSTYFGSVPYSLSTTNAVAVHTIPSDGAGGFDYPNADFGFFGITPGTIGDLVYLDVDKNGAYNAGDAPLPNVTVQLYLDANGNGVADTGELFATQVTDLNGGYLFMNLGPGNYIVKVLGTDPDIPAGTVGTVSQFNVALTQGQNSLTNDFPYIRILDKTVNKAYEVANGILTYIITPYYPGNTSLNIVQVVDSVPVGTTYNGNPSPTPASAPSIGGTGSVTWNLGSTVAAVNGIGTTPGYTPTAITRSTTTEVDDTYVSMHDATTWYGGGTELVTRPANASTIKAAMMRFTLPSFATSDVIDRAFIRVMVMTGRTSNHTVTMRRLTTAWTEGTSAANGATWNDPNGTGAAGVWAATTFSASDYDTTVSYGSFSAPFVTGQTLEFDVTDLVRAWRAGTLANNGVALIASGTDAGDLIFYSSEGSGASTPGPRLEIAYSVSGSGSSTVLDQFGTAAYNNNNGTRNWAGGWIETGEKGDVGGGDMKISGSQLVVKDGTGGKSIYRSADLAGATAATLTFSLAANTLNDAGDKVKIQASITGGSSWVDLDTFTAGTATGSKTYNLITLLGSVNKDTRIRFLQAGRIGGAKQIQVDNVQISYTTPTGGTTTTQLSADTALLSGTRNVTVSMTVKSDVSCNVTPPTDLTVTTTGGTAAATKVSGPTPTTGSADSIGVTFTYVYQVTSGAAIGSVKFSGVPTGPSGTVFNSGTSQSVLTTPVLTFQAKVNNPAPSPGPIVNTADFKTNSVLMVTSPPAVTATKGSIGDFVWLDTNGDGLQGTSEPGIAGVTVNVYLDANMDGVPDGGVVGTAVTDTTGHYEVYGLDAGNYLVRYDSSTAPSGYVPTTATVKTVYGLTVGQQYTAADFGLRPPAPAGTASTIGDTVWMDLNNNGVVDAGEAGIANVDVRLYIDLNNNGVVDFSDPLVATTSTDANGNYLFTGVYTGNYVVNVNTSDPQFPAGVALVSGGSPVTSPPANGVQAVH